MITATHCCPQCVWPEPFAECLTSPPAGPLVEDSRLQGDLLQIWSVKASHQHRWLGGYSFSDSGYGVGLVTKMLGQDGH